MTTKGKGLTKKLKWFCFLIQAYPAENRRVVKLYIVMAITWTYGVANKSISNRTNKIDGYKTNSCFSL